MGFVDSLTHTTVTKVTIKWEPTQLILSSEKFAFHKEVFALDLKNSEGFSPLLTLALWVKVDNLHHLRVKNFWRTYLV